jgi:hypothetical protein
MVKGEPVSSDRAKAIVEKAAQEASDVLKATQADPLKQPKQLKADVKEAVAKRVESGDPSQVVHYIKDNKKQFISGVYQSWFMKEIRAQLEGSSGAAASSKQPQKTAAPGGGATSASATGKRASASKEMPKKRRKKENSASEQESDDSGDSEAEGSAEKDKQVASPPDKAKA